MWHPHPHISPGIDACGNCTLNISERVVQQHFVVTDVNAGGRHAGKSAVKGRSQRMFRVGAPQVGMHELRYLRASKKGIGIRARLVGRARKSQVGDRRQHGNSDKSRVDGGGFAGHARREYQCQIASSGVSRKSDPVNALLGKSSVTRQHIVRGRRKRMFGSKPIVRDERPRSRPCSNMPDKMAVGLGGPKVEPTTVQVDDRLARPPIRRLYPKPRYTAESVCFECHVVAWQYVLHESVELSARFDSLSRALGGADHGAKGGGDRCVFGIERMYYDRTRRRAACG